MIQFKDRDLRPTNLLILAFIQRSLFSALMLAALSVVAFAQNASFSIQHDEKAVSGQYPSKRTIAQPAGTREQATNLIPIPGESDVEGSDHGSDRPDVEQKEDRQKGPATAGESRKTETTSVELGDVTPKKGGALEETTGSIDKNSFLLDNWRTFDKKIATTSVTDTEDDPDAKTVPTRIFHWGPAIRQAMVMQLFQHSFALAVQEKTRRGLKGPFFSDYVNSVQGLHGWDDGNQFFTNYVAHPMQGATTGFIFIQNHERAKRQKFNESKEYWIDRLKTFAWAAAWSTNWELGPISQASIGNVGLNGGMGYVDLVITPTVGTAWTITEEAIDRYVIRHHEWKGLTTKILMRTFLNPMRTMANLLRFKRPWYRDREYYTAYLGS